MIKSTVWALSVLVITSCSNQTAPENTAGVSENTDTVAPVTSGVISFDVTRITPGGEQVKKANSYFVVDQGDTSLFTCHFSEWKSDSTIVFVAKFHKAMTYARQKQELKQILAQAGRDFNLERLNTIGLGRLITTGDLTAKVTAQFAAISYRDELNAFLLRSAMTEDINALLSPYRLKVKQVVTEKQEYMPREELSKYSVIETPIKDIPAEVIDCIVYLKLERA